MLSEKDIPICAALLQCAILKVKIKWLLQCQDIER